MEGKYSSGSGYSPVPPEHLHGGSNTNFTPNAPYRQTFGHQRLPGTLPVEWRGPSRLPLLLEVFNVAVGVFFFAAGFVFISLNHKEQTNWSDTVIQFSRIMPTLWPIVFAAILGNAIKWFAYWRLESSIELQVNVHSS
jgi:peptidoglycan/LPS O-acetylase OafA/YrhL